MGFKNIRLARFDGLFGVDLRSLAVFRIGVALTIISDLFIRATDLVAHYTDIGLVPRVTLIDPWPFSIHLLSGSTFVQGLLFFIAGLFAFALLIGYRTQFVTVTSWFLLLSLQARVPLVFEGADVLLRVLLFWGMFVPWGAYYSIDRALNASSQKIPERVASMGTAGLLLQILFVYMFAGVSKLQVGDWIEGNAVYYALSVDLIARAPGVFLLSFPSLMVFLNYAVLLFELSSVFLLFSPIFSAPLRMVAILGFLFLHVSFGLSLSIGLFPLIGIVSLFPFLPTEFWNIILKWRPIVAIGTVYKYIITRHGFWSKFVITLPPGPLRVESPWLISALAAFFLIYIFFWNLGVFYEIKDDITWISFSLQLNQSWSMFAPFVFEEDGWYVIPGILKDGSRVNLIRGEGSVTWGKPTLLSATYKNQRWRRHAFNLLSDEFKHYRQYFARYLCYQWDMRHEETKQLKELEIFYIFERTLPDYQAPDIERERFLRYDCVNEREILTNDTS